MKRFLVIFSLLVVGSLAFGFVLPPEKLEALKSSLSVTGVANEAFDQAAFQGRCLTDMNQRRLQVNLLPLKRDPEVQEMLKTWCQTKPFSPEVDLQHVFRYLEQAVPTIHAMAATVCWDTNSNAVQEGLLRWEDVIDGQQECLSTYIIRDGLRVGCLAVLTQRLPVFDLDNAKEQKGPALTQCGRCGGTHLVSLEDVRRTIVLRCPDCRKAYDLLACDSEGMFRRANYFLTGESRLSFANQPPSEELLLKIWRAVLTGSHYELDDDAEEQVESWKTPRETVDDRSGDCEDTSILMTDILLTEGFDARVALGWNVYGGEHAWCVVRLNGKQYLIETTDRRSDTPVLRTVEELAQYYTPEQTFDRKQIYFCDDKPGAAEDYWNEDIWTAVSNDKTRLALK